MPPIAAVPERRADHGLVALHDHLDGGLRVRTLAEWAVADGLAQDVDAAQAQLARRFADNTHAGTLTAYLDGFVATVGPMGALDRIRRVAAEAAADVAADGVVLAEFRMAPDLWIERGLAPAAVIDAVLDGLASQPAGPRWSCGLIVCALRHFPADRMAAVADAALATFERDCGRDGVARVIGFDLAGPEAGFPPGRHAAQLRRVTAAGLPLTLHAGEADAGERVLEAAALGARRIGHGIRIADLLAGPRRQEVVERMQGRMFEVCPSSNVHTGAVDALAAHPLRAMDEAGLAVSVHVDNRLMSQTSASAETALLESTLGFEAGAARRLHAAAARASFLGDAAIARALACIDGSKQHPDSQPAASHAAARS